MCVNASANLEVQLSLRSLVGGSGNIGTQLDAQEMMKRNFRKTQFTALESISALSSACYVRAAPLNSLHRSRNSHFANRIRGIRGVAKPFKALVGRLDWSHKGGSEGARHSMDALNGTCSLGA